MKRLLIAACLSVFFTVSTLFVGVVLAQAPAPTISDSGSGNIPSDPGMYVQTAGGFNKILGQIVSFTRSGSLLVSGLTVGIKSRKANVQLLGAHAQTIIDGKPVFFFIPPRQEADAGVNAGDLVLMRLEEKAKRRQFEVAAQGAWRASSGISITHQIQLLRSETKLGIYTITPSLELGKGEYALYLARGEGMQAYVYDFSVSSTCCSPSRHPNKDETAPAVQTPPMTALAGVKATKTDNGSFGDAGTKASNRSYSTGEVTAEISSDPLGADIEIDGNFVGNTPSTVGIGAGEHTLRVSKSGYNRWERTLKSSTGQIKIAAVLEPSTVTDPAPPANLSRGTAEEARIGVWSTANPTARHDGIEISGVQPNGPADGIGIRPGDLIIAIDGHYLYTIDELRAELSQHEPGARLAIRYRHGRLTYDNYLALSSKDAATLR
jgi:hypothetical protein